MRATVAPNIKENIKDKETKKFIKLSKQDLIAQIRKVLKPKFDINQMESIEEILKANLNGDDPDSIEESESCFDIGNGGIFKNTLDTKSLGVVLDPTSLQLYEPCRYGFFCGDGTENLSDKALVTEIVDFDFIKKRGNVYMCCKVSKSDLNS